MIINILGYFSLGIFLQGPSLVHTLLGVMFICASKKKKKYNDVLPAWQMPVLWRWDREEGEFLFLTSAEDWMDFKKCIDKENSY